MIVRPRFRPLARPGMPAVITSGGTPSTWAFPGASLDLDFVQDYGYQGGLYSNSTSLLTVSRASSGTDLLPTSAAGATYSTFLSNIARLTLGVGLLIEEARTNNLLNSAVPVTQTTASLGTGTYTLWVNGSGSATSSAGSATGSGFGAATNGTPNVFTLTGAGTVTVTVVDPLNAFQLEAGTFGTSLIVTAGAAATRAADRVDLVSPSIVQNGTVSFFAKFNFNQSPAIMPTTAVVLGWARVQSFTDTQYITIASGTGACAGANVVGGSGDFAANPGVAILNTATHKVVQAVSLNSGAVATDGTVSATDSSVSPAPGPAGFFTIGAAPWAAGNSSNPLNGWVQEIGVWNRRLSAAELQALTT